jgi:hypothetical protein
MALIRAASASFGVAAVLVVSPAPTAATAGAPGEVTSSDTTRAGVVINEFAPSGPFGSTDEFLELRNTSSQWVALDGWDLSVCLSPGLTVVLVTFGASDMIGPGEYLLLAHIDSSIGPSDYVYGGWDVPDDGGWLVRDPWSGKSDGGGLRSGLDCTEGAPAPHCDWAAGDAVTRDEQGKDTNDNAAEFTCQPHTPGF